MKHKNHDREERAAEETRPTDIPEEAAATAPEWEPVEAEQQPPAPSAEEKLAAEIQDLKEKLVYLQADYQNYRKRVVKDISDARAYGTENALNPFLTVFDFLAMAKTAAQKSDNIESIRQGLEMIINEFNKAFDELGVRKIETAGAVFNPAVHEAAAKENSDTIPEGKVVREWSGGFQMGNRLLRPARVVVSAGPAVPAAGDTEEKE